MYLGLDQGCHHLTATFVCWDVENSSHLFQIWFDFNLDE